MLRIITVLALSVRLVYWIINEQAANRKKPKLKKSALNEVNIRLVLWIFSLVMILQLLGINIFPYSENTIYQYIGLALVIVGVALSFIARKNLGDNWTHAAEYQIKKDHELITSGAYKYIRHPMQRFERRYRDYLKSTKMLIPFVW